MEPGAGRSSGSHGERTKVRLVRLTDSILDRVERLGAKPSRPSTKTRLTCVFLQWDAVRTSAELDALIHRLESFPEIETTVVLVNNGSGEAAVDSRKVTLVVDGDNSAYEFSGFQAGVDAVRRSGIPTDVWVIANDRFRAGNRRFLRYLSPAAIHAASALPSLVGQVDSYPQPVSSFGYSLQRWVTTSLFLMSDDVLTRCSPLVSVSKEEIANCLGSDPLTIAADGPVGRQHAAYLLAWLTGAAGTDLTSRWYGWDPALDPAVFRRKVQSILNEQLLSARAVAAGVALVPMQVAHRLATVGLDGPAARREAGRILHRPEFGGVAATRSVRVQFARHVLLRRAT